jgi:ribosomal protein S17E
MSQWRRPTLRERLEDNILIAIVAAAVVTGTTVAGVMEFLTTQNEKIVTATYDGKMEELKQTAKILTNKYDAQIAGLEQQQRIVTAKYDAQIDELKNHIAVITRSLAGQETLNVRKMFLEQQ